jgi:choline kinase
VRYLILAAGLGRRLGRAGGALPKAMLDVGGETLVDRLLRQMRRADAEADIEVVAGYCADALAPLLHGCRIVVNPFFDITGINASLWFARESFDRPLTVVHGDLVLSDALAAALFRPDDPGPLVAYDSRILDPKEINVAVAGERVTRFGVNFDGYSGAYAGVLKLDERAARLFAATLDARMRRGFNEPRTYYFFVLRALLAAPGMVLRPFDFAPHRWQEIDRPADIEAARRVVLGDGGADAR